MNGELSAGPWLAHSLLDVQLDWSPGPVANHSAIAMALRRLLGKLPNTDLVGLPLYHFASPGIGPSWSNLIPVQFMNPKHTFAVTMST